MTRVDELTVDQGLAVAETVALPAWEKFFLDKWNEAAHHPLSR
jgi:hypothetical protein